MPQTVYSQSQDPAAASSSSHGYEQYDYDQTYPAATPPRQSSRPNMHRHTDSAASNTPLMQQPYRGSPSGRGPSSPTRRGNSFSATPAAAVGGIGTIPPRWQQGGHYDGIVDPSNLTDDDGDADVFSDRPRSKKSRGRLGGAAAAGLGAAAAATAAGGTAAASKGGFKVFDVRRGSEEGSNFAPQYDNNHTNRNSDPEKSEWLDKQSNGSKKLKWIVGSILLLVVIAAVVGGTTGGILGMQKSSDSNGSTTKPSSSSSSSKNGLYTHSSPEVRALLNNTALHRVFPGMDYTPQNAQYPACLTDPLSQNDITLDVAQLAQLTPAIRLYGTDCGQTEMVLEAISLLGYNHTLQVWLGVWLGDNSTTNTRQMSQMEDILREWPRERFAGVIVGNEVLFREDMSETELAGHLTDVRSSLAALGIDDLPVATSDLGDDWTAELAGDSDIVMANVHPFFAGVTPKAAPGWTWDFWQGHNVGLKNGTGDEKWPGSIVAEVGWPSDGGTNCGGKTGVCADGEEGAVASIEGLNAFMEGWVCEALRNGTTYFW